MCIRDSDAIYLSPCTKSLTLSEMTGNQVFLKLENLQMTGSFKERGALNRLLTLSKDEAVRGVTTASAGNHAQGLAYHATRLGIRSEIVMPLHTPLVKVSRTQGYGGNVILHGINYDEAYQEAMRRCEVAGSTFVHA